MRGIVRGAVDIGASRLLRMGAALAFQAGAARFLGPSGYGLLQHALSGAALTQQATDLGAGPATSVGLARAGLGAGARTRGTAGVLRTGAVLRTGLTLALVMALLLAPHRLEPVFGSSMVGWGVILALAGGWAAFLEHVLVGVRRTRTLLVASLLLFAVPAAAGLVTVLVRPDPVAVLRSLAWATLVGVVLVATLVVSMMGQLLREGRGTEATEDEPAAGPPFRFSRTALSLAVVSLSAVIIVRLPVLVLANAGNAAGAGMLGAGVALVERGGVVGTAMGLSAGPALASWMHEEADLSEARSALRAGSLGGLWLGGLLLALGPAAILVVLGVEYAPLIALLPWIAVALFLQASLQTLGGLLDYGGWAGPRALALAVGAAVVAVGSGLVEPSPLRAMQVVVAGLLSVLCVLAVVPAGAVAAARVRAVMSVVWADLALMAVLSAAVTLARAAAPAVPYWIDACVTGSLVGGVLLVRGRGRWLR